MSFSPWEMLDDGLFNGLRKWIRSSGDDEGTVQVAYDQINLQDTLDDNKWAQNHVSVNKRADMWHAATIPPIVELEWRTKYGVRLNDPNHKAAVKRLLNSNEYAYLKRAPIVI